MLKLKDELDNNGTFPDEQVLFVSKDLIPWFTGFLNYLVSDVVYEKLSF